MSDKIKPHHQARKAILYIRQSSAHQVHHNLESQRLQQPRQRYRRVHPSVRETSTASPSRSERTRGTDVSAFGSTRSRRCRWRYFLRPILHDR